VFHDIIDIFLQLSDAHFLKLLRLQIQGRPNTFLWQFWNYASSVILNQLVVEKLEIVETAGHDGVVGGLVELSRFYFVEFVTFYVSLLDQLWFL
jgi:hypothetical protein